MAKRENRTFHCNRCGRYHTEYEMDNFEGNFFHDFSAYFGYGSPYDDCFFEFTLCELCMFEIAKDFKHTPMILDKDPFAPPDEQVVPFDYNEFQRRRTEPTPYYKNLFIENYNDIENLPKK
ncbi:hypothetical protein [Oceanobacillus jeddahense]|uniref:Uncharacterized protein n=1 Tax=Oceanobacillus jeddahense TaxID=1462527 RepID=A0ABY5JWZ8_9BACI|nr:hypothetical protein [Oceanobacillus jeddahense]UUI04918.1 hypothetical protein NP439_09895 [Oceanobacillus jeddahense]